MITPPLQRDGSNPPERIHDCARSRAGLSSASPLPRSQDVQLREVPHTSWYRHFGDCPTPIRVVG